MCQMHSMPAPVTTVTPLLQSKYNTQSRTKMVLLKSGACYRGLTNFELSGQSLYKAILKIVVTIFIITIITYVYESNFEIIFVVS